MSIQNSGLSTTSALKSALLRRTPIPLRVKAWLPVTAALQLFPNSPPSLNAPPVSALAPLPLPCYCSAHPAPSMVLPRGLCTRSFSSLNCSPPTHLCTFTVLPFRSLLECPFVSLAFLFTLYKMVTPYFAWVLSVVFLTTCHCVFACLLFWSVFPMRAEVCYFCSLFYSQCLAQGLANSSI